MSAPISIFREIFRQSLRTSRLVYMFAATTALYAGAFVLIVAWVAPHIAERLFTPITLGGALVILGLGLLVSSYLGIFEPIKTEPRSASTTTEDISANSLRLLMKEMRVALSHLKGSEINISAPAQVNIDDAFKKDVL